MAEQETSSGVVPGSAQDQGQSGLNPDFIQNMHDRFLNSAQDILCDSEAAQSVASAAVQKFQKESVKWEKRSLRTQSLLQRAIEYLDTEIDSYFLHMLDKIRHQDRQTEKTFLTMIEDKFRRNIHYKISFDSVHWDKPDIDDVVNEAVSIVSRRGTEAEFKGLFIQWAQTVLNNKYRERRRQKIRQMLRERKIEDEAYEKRYDSRLSDVVDKRRATEVDPEEASVRKRDFPEQEPADPFAGDVHYFEPDVLIEGEDLREQLLVLVKRIKRKACAKVFRVLFSEGDRKFMAEQFPNRTKQQIDLIVSQCRKQLRLEAERMGVL